jgi:hypothetical protein
MHAKRIELVTCTMQNEPNGRTAPAKEGSIPESRPTTMGLQQGQVLANSDDKGTEE